MARHKPTPGQATRAESGWLAAPPRLASLGPVIDGIDPVSVLLDWTEMMMLSTLVVLSYLAPWVPLAMVSPDKLAKSLMKAHFGLQ